MAAPNSPAAKNRPVQFGDYTILGRLGEGGMCHVFRARKKGETHECALKVLKEDQRKDDQVLDLFVTEADLSLLLSHPNLIATFDAGEVKGRYYIAMELIEGGNLREIATQSERLGIPLPPDFAMYMVTEVLEGLDAVHNATNPSGAPLGLVHRDVTPHNVFVDFGGRVILGDFGIAQIKAYGDAEPGTAMGKIGYLSPEAASGEEVDRRADLFAVGIILYELLTGTRLYASGSDEQILEAVAEARAVRPRKIKPNISKGLEAVIMKALAKRRKDRFETAEEMVYALEPFWSTRLGNPRALASFMAGLYRDEARAWEAKVPSRRRRAEP